MQRYVECHSATVSSTKRFACRGGSHAWQYEWNDFLDSIRNDRPHNEAKRAVYSDFTTLMGRAACHTGQTVTWDEMMKSNFRFCDYVDKLDFGSPVPVKADENGRFPAPIPGQWKEF